MSENENLQPQTATPAFCMFCGSPLQPGSAFCPSCGKKVFFQPQVPQQPYQQQPQNEKLVVNDLTKYHLSSSAKWVKATAIIGSVISSVLAIFGVWLITKRAPGPGIVYIVIAGIYLFPIIKSFGFSNHVRAALETDDSDELVQGMSNLRGLTTFMGVMAIIGIVILIICIVQAIDTYTYLRSYYSRW